MEKRGQITIFIIVGIVIVATVILVLIFKGEIIPKIGGGYETNPNVFIDTCLNDKIKETVILISSQGGYTNPLLYKGYDNKKIAYLCYTESNYKSCTVLEPMLIQHLKNEIKNYITEDTKECFNELTESLKKRYEVESEYNDFEVDLNPGKIIINIDGRITLTKSGETTKQENFKLITQSEIYDLSVIAQEIVNQESEYCNFDYMGYMLLHPGIRIEKNTLDDSTIIYYLKNRKTSDGFWFAVRGCALPGGI